MTDQKTILIVDDDPHQRRFFEVILGEEGYRVLAAEDGLEGLRTARDQAPDLILMDFLLPEMSGKEVTENLKADDILKDIPIVAMTAFPFQEEEEAFEEWGFDDCFNKPIAAEDLLALIGKYLS